ncbi:hypothetical protein KEJ27_10220 [Candidatus Bathyarchaeota archaeon]|nr:hypothetical protein [Candidatus Bathyarchaeota archaeon]
MNFEEPDRIGYTDSDLFPDTIPSWRSEGLPEGIDGVWINIPGLRYFEMDIYSIWFNASPGYDSILYEETEGYVIVRGGSGSKSKHWKARSSPPLRLEPAIKNLEEFKEKIEPLLDPDEMRRLSSPKYPYKKDLKEVIRKFQEEFFVTVNIPGVIEYSMDLLGGLAPLLALIMREPSSVSYIFNSIADFLSKAVERFIEAGVDALWVFDDEGYRKGSYFSPEVYVKLVQPAHKKICDPFRKEGLPRILHTDGNVNALVPHFIDAGFTALHPLEAKSGMDVRNLKEKYGDKLALIGNIDTRILSFGTLENIKSEVMSKISSAASGGGYIASSDGPVPPTVSLTKYKFFVEVVRKYGRYPLHV